MSNSSSNSFTANTSEAMSRLHGSVRKAFTGYYRTSDFIRRIRGCKTASDERALVARESAAIRDSFKKHQIGREQKYHSLAKLIYLHLLGYPAHFGQIECMKLAAAAGTDSSFSLKDKRLGYLGVSLLSDEHQETLTLVTNSLKFDLSSSEEPLQALALSTLARIASTEMARELAGEVEKLLQATSSNIRKRAAAAATKLVQKDPELADVFDSRLSALIFTDRSHSVQLSALGLFQTILAAPGYLEIASNIAHHFKLLPGLIKLLQSLQTSPLDTECDISSVPDPLLQIAILRTIRLLFKSASSSVPQEEQTIENLNDLLAQLATTLDSSKNVGNAVLYEVVLTIMALPGLDPSLTNLAIGTLGRFLTGNACGDNNLRYVALNLLTRILNSNPSRHIVQIHKHQTTILACLHDADSTIRKKAADLAILLVNSQASLAQVAPELLALAAREDSPEVTHNLLYKLSGVILKHARDPIVFTNLYISFLKQVNSSHPRKNEIVSEFIQHTTASLNNHTGKHHEVQVVRELYFALTILHEDTDVVADSTTENGSVDLDLSISNDSLLMDRRKLTLPSDGLLEAAFWFFGEFGQFVPLESLCSASELVNLLAAFVTYCSPSISLYALNALAKLTTRIPDQLEAIKTILGDSRVFFKSIHQFDLLDRTNELLIIVSNSKMRKIAFEPAKFHYLKFDLDSESVTSESIMHITDNDHEPDHHSNQEPDLILDQINVFIDQSQVTTSTSLQVQFYFTCNGREALKQVSIALAVPRGFDFDYLAPASGSELNGPEDRISLSILIRKLAKDPTDLLDFDLETTPEIIDWNATCKVKIKASYQVLTEGDGRIHQKIGQVPQVHPN